MQRILTILPIIVSAAVLSGQTDPPGRVGRLNYVNGPVSFQPAGVTDWVDAEVNRPLTTGDQVWVGDGGRAEVHVGSTALRFDSNTAFQFLNLNDQTVQIQLSQGTLTVRARNLAQNQNLELDTPSMAFTVLRPGEYRIVANHDSQTTTVTVRDGDGEVTGGGQTFPVHARQMAIATGSDQVTYNLVAAPEADEWDQWNASRDRREDGSPSARYVSREVNGYEDLDQYGSWASQPGYGQVWMPTTVTEDWAPYHDGHWAWIAPWGWTWVDDAPWGFAPYHYGRWASFNGRWGWVPGPYGVTPLYAPALVGWIGGGGGGSSFSLSFSFGSAAAVGWFPLGPREPYFPAYRVSSGYFGRVNNTNTVINTTTINNYYNNNSYYTGGRNSTNPSIANIRYANQTVPNAVMAVPQDRFANGHQVSESARAVSGAQLATARLVAAPEIAPQRASVLGPRAAEASRAPRPPATVLSRPVVARTAPPPAPVPFERQQTVLNQNPGRPLPPATVQQMGLSAPARSSPVRVVDMSRVERIQPRVGATQQGATPGSPARTQQQPAPNAPPAASNRQNEPPSNATARQDGRWSAPVAKPGAPSSKRSPEPQNAPSPGVVRQPAVTVAPNTPASRPGESPSHAAQQNGRWSTPVARPDAPPPNTPAQRSAPVPRVVQPPAVPPAPAASNPPNTNSRQQAAPPPNVVHQPGTPPQGTAASRTGESRSHATAKQSGAWSTPVAKPDALPPNAKPHPQNAPVPHVEQQPVAPPIPAADARALELPANAAPAARQDAQPSHANPRQQSTRSPNVVQQPSVAPPVAANSRPAGTPSAMPQAEQQRNRTASPPKSNRSPAQQPQQQPPQQIKQVPLETEHAAPPPKEAKDKPDKNDPKK
jgi:hypothetical protein